MGAIKLSLIRKHYEPIGKEFSIGDINTMRS